MDTWDRIGAKFKQTPSIKAQCLRCETTDDLVDYTLNDNGNESTVRLCKPCAEYDRHMNTPCWWWQNDKVYEWQTAATRKQALADAAVLGFTEEKIGLTYARPKPVDFKGLMESTTLIESLSEINNWVGTVERSVVQEIDLAEMVDTTIKRWFYKHRLINPAPEPAVSLPWPQETD